MTSLFLLLEHPGFTAPTHAKDVEGQTHTLKGKLVPFEIFPAFTETQWEFHS